MKRTTSLLTTGALGLGSFALISTVGWANSGSLGGSRRRSASGSRSEGSPTAAASSGSTAGGM